MKCQMPYCKKKPTAWFNLLYVCQDHFNELLQRQKARAGSNLAKYPKPIKKEGNLK